MALWRISCCLILLASCKNTTPLPDSGATPAPVVAEQTAYVIAVDHLRMRANPEGEAEVVHTLREGEVVYWAGEASERQQTVNLRGKEIRAPWYAVTTPDGREGWIFSGALEPWPPGRGLPYRECLESFRKADFSGFYPCLDRVSHTLSGPEKVAVTPNYLRLRLASGEQRQFDHVRTPGPDYRLYQYLGLIPGADAYVLKVNRQGGSGFMLVSRQTGQTLEVAGIPQNLPATRSLFCLGSLPGQAGSYTLQVVHPEARQWTVALEQQFPGQSLAGLSWRKNGLPEVALRDHQGVLNRWMLIRKPGAQWDLEPIP